MAVLGHPGQNTLAGRPSAWSGVRCQTPFATPANTVHGPQQRITWSSCRQRLASRPALSLPTKPHMDAERVLALWEGAHGALAPSWREAFLRHPALAGLRQLPEAAVIFALGGSNKLARVAEIAADVSWWFEGKPCEEDALPWCARCKPHTYPPVVVVTRGWGEAFHTSEDCPWLLKGQDAVVARGGEPAPVERVNVQVAIGSGKLPCLWCFPPSTRRRSPAGAIPQAAAPTTGR